MAVRKQKKVKKGKKIKIFDKGSSQEAPNTSQVNPVYSAVGATMPTGKIIDVEGAIKKDKEVREEDIFDFSFSNKDESKKRK